MGLDIGDEVRIRPHVWATLSDYPNLLTYRVREIGQWGPHIDMIMLCGFLWWFKEEELERVA